jgi:hypothetical protein
VWFRHPLTASSLHDREDHRVIGLNSLPRLYHGFATGPAKSSETRLPNATTAALRVEGKGYAESDNSDMHYCDCDCATQSCISIGAGLCETTGSERGAALTRQARRGGGGGGRLRGEQREKGGT